MREEEGIFSEKKETTLGESAARKKKTGSEREDVCCKRSFTNLKKKKFRVLVLHFCFGEEEIREKKKRLFHFRGKFWFPCSYVNSN